MKLRTHFALLVAVTAIPLALLVVALVLVAQRQERASVERGLQDTVRALAAAMDRELETSVTALRALGTSPALDRGNLRDFYEHARRTRELQPQWLTVYLVDAAGTHRMTLLRPLGSPLPAPQPIDHIRAVLDRGQPEVSDVLFGPVSRRHIVVITVPVVRDGEVRYALGASLATSILAERLRHQVRSPDAIATLFDRSNTVVARTPNPERFVGRAAPGGLVEKLPAAGSTQETVFGSPSLEGASLLMAASRLRLSGFTIVVGIPRLPVMSGPFTNVVALGGSVILATALAASIVLSRRVGRSMATLTATATELASGETIRTPPPQAVAESQAVHRAMVEAADALAQRTQERSRRVAAEAAEAESAAARRLAESESRAKDAFLAMLSHELRNPLSAITSALEVARVAGGAEAAATRAHDVMRTQLRHLVQIVDDLLDVTRVTTGKVLLTRRPTDLAAVVRRAVDTVTATGKVRGRRLALGMDPVWVDGDETRLEQVAGNLLTNALKYTGPEGSIDVSVTAEEANAVLRVQDAGIGIDKERLPFVFDLFYQADVGLARSQGGLGIGLTLVKQLVELHGGAVTASSGGRDRGATFVVTLPRIAEPRVPVPEARAAHGAAASARRILLIEDNDDAREMLEAGLRLAGHEVAGVPTGEAGLELVSTVLPDVVFVDLGLPGMDGYAVARRLRQMPHGKTAFLVALTGYGRPQDVRRAEEAGFDLHLVKPVDHDRLARVIATAANRAS